MILYHVFVAKLTKANKLKTVALLNDKFKGNTCILQKKACLLDYRLIESMLSDVIDG